MKIRGLIIAAVVFFALAGVLYWSDHHKPADDVAKTTADTPPAILKLDQASIEKLIVKKKDADAVVLSKTSSGDWHIDEPKPLGADQSTVSGMLSTLSSLNSERLVEDKAANLKNYGLDAPSLEVDIGEKGGKTQRLLVGDDTPTGGSVYVALGGDPRVFTAGSFAKTSLDKTLNDLRDKRLITAASDKISRLELIRKNQDIEFGRNKDEWQILKPKPLRADSSQVDDLVRRMTDARMDLSASEPKDATADFAHATPVATAKVTDQSGTQQIEIRKNKDTYYAKSSVVEGAYKVGTDLGEAVNKGIDDFRNKKLFGFGFSDPNKIELHNGTKAYYLVRGGEDWWSNGKKMEPDGVQSFVSDVRDLSASKFADSGFADPTIELAVTSGDGKTLEKVSIAKSGSDYIAKRENDPTLYVLDSGPVDAFLKAADDIKAAATPMQK